jgi:hypothetical protein
VHTTLALRLDTTPRAELKGNMEDIFMLPLFSLAQAFQLVDGWNIQV